MKKSLIYRDCFFSGRVDYKNYQVGRPQAVALVQPKGANRVVRRRVAKMVRKQSGGKRTLSAYTPTSENEPHRGPWT